MLPKLPTELIELPAAVAIKLLPVMLITPALPLAGLMPALLLLPSGDAAASVPLDERACIGPPLPLPYITCATPLLLLPLLNASPMIAAAPAAWLPLPVLPYGDALPPVQFSRSPSPPLSCLLMLQLLRKQPPPLLGVRAMPPGLLGLLPSSVPALLRPIRLCLNAGVNNGTGLLPLLPGKSAAARLKR